MADVKSDSSPGNSAYGHVKIVKFPVSDKAVSQDRGLDTNSVESNFAQPTERITEQPSYYCGPENQLLRDPDNAQGAKKLRF
jgi:hypothetical protein